MISNKARVASEKTGVRSNQALVIPAGTSFPLRLLSPQDGAAGCNFNHTPCIYQRLQLFSEVIKNER